MDEVVIELNDLTKKYGDFAAVDHLNLFIKKGEVFGLLGPNGAGKSTTILMLLGLTEPTSGTVKVCGIAPPSNPIEVKRKVGYLPEDVGFYEDLTGLENLVFTGRLNNLSRSLATEKARKLLERIGLSEAVNKKVGKYSRGMRQRLGLADVLIKSPEIIILDEPTLGIDPTGVKEFLELIVELSKADGLTVLFSSHHLHQVQKVCDRVGLFVNGKLLAVGDINTLSKQLFTENNILVEVGLDKHFHPEETDLHQTGAIERIREILNLIEGVQNISRTDGIYQIECTSNKSAEIARALISSGIYINYLTTKEYGLDDIYYRYFEGGLHGK